MSGGSRSNTCFKSLIFFAFATILDSGGDMLKLKGKAVADSLYKELREKTLNWERKPHLSVVLVGNDPASEIYVSHKQKACEALGFGSSLHRLSDKATAAELRATLLQLNQDSSVDAILLQLPLPEHLNAREMTDLIAFEKDADGLTTMALGKLAAGQQLVSSCTPSGVIEILKHYQIPVQSRKALIVGRSLIVGTPLFHLLNQQNATVTLAHSKTPDLKKMLQEYESVFVAIGKPKFFKAQDFKKDAVVVDVGIHRLADGICGDVDSDGAEEYLSALTPVPGGVGPMTIAMLMKNTYLLAEQSRKRTNYE